MGATGYIIKGHNRGSNEPEKTYNVVPADGTIDVERIEAENEVTFAIKTTYDGYETIEGGSPSGGGYYKAVHVKFNAKTRRYRLVCILNGGSYTPVARDFAIYYIKMGYKTGGENDNHWYIQEYSRVGNGSYVTLEQISTTEYNILIHTPAGYAYANIGVLKEDKEPDVLIEHFNFNRTRYTPTGTLITTDVPTWRNGAPAVWQVIPDVVNPVAGMLGHYYNLDRNLYFYDGFNWHLVYALAQGVASMLATTDAPTTANDGTIYFDLTEGNLKIWINGGWQDIINVVQSARQVVYNLSNVPPKKEGMLRVAQQVGYYGGLQVYNGDMWQYVQATADRIFTRSTWNSPQNTSVGVESDGRFKYAYGGVKHILAYLDEVHISQVVTFTNYSGQTIVANDVEKIVVTASFGSTSILDFSNIEKEEGKVIEISNLNGNTITMKDGATTLHLTNSNESVIKAICLSSVWHYYKVGSITEFT